MRSALPALSVPSVVRYVAKRYLAKARVRSVSASAPAPTPAYTPAAVVLGITLVGNLLLGACSQPVTSPDNAAARSPDAAAAALSAAVVYPTVQAVSPPTTLTVGQHVNLTSLVYTAPGSAHIGQSVAWKSSDPTILSVTVTNSGELSGDTAHVTALKAGSVKLILTTVSQTTDTLKVTVVSPTTTPTVPPITTALTGGSLAGCGLPNIMGLNFSSGNFGNFDTSTMHGAKIVTDATAPSGKSLLTQWTYSPSSDEGSSVNGIFSTPRQVAYARFAYKQDVTFDDDGGIKKLARFRAAGFGNMMGTLYVNYGQLEWFYDGLYDAKDIYQNVGTPFSPDSFKGAWHWIEIMNDISHSGALHVQVWVDGALKIDQTVNASNQGWTFSMVEFGGTYNEPAGNTRDWTDGLAVSSNCIGAP